MLRLTGDAQLVTALDEGREPAALTDRERALVRFALALNAPAPSMMPADLDELRRAGFDDAQILDAVQVVAYFGFVNRLADALGVPLEPFHGGPEVG